MSKTADRVTAPAVKSKGPSLSKAPAAALQRKCACGGKCNGECEECKKKKQAGLLRSGYGATGATVPGIVGNALNTAGVPLESGARSVMESRFGRDFSDVRVHTGGLAAESANAVNAHAYTVGQDIVFGHGQYQPSTPTGQRLIAHELAHTVQQHGLQPSSDVSFETGSTMHALEAEADAAANAVTAGIAVPTLSVQPQTPTLSRTARSATPPTPAAGATGAGTPAATEAPALNWQRLTNPIAVGSGQQATDRASFGTTTVAYRVDKFKLPREKGPVADQYRAQARTGSLRATLDFSGTALRTAMWQKREASQELRNNWMLRYGIASTGAAEAWKNAGGKDPGSGGFPNTNPHTNASTCDLDHIVELQIGGTNVPENLQVLNSADNQGSGRSIWDQVSGIATELKQRETDTNVTQIVVQFIEVEQVGGDAAWPTLATGPVAVGTAASCTHAEAAIRRSAGSPASLAAAEQATWEAYTTQAGGQTGQFLLPPAPARGGTVTEMSTNAQNVAASEVIPGMIIKSINRRAASLRTDTAQACIEGPGCAKRTAERGTRVPVEITRGQQVNLSIAAGDPRRIALTPGQGRNVQFHYPYLSEGRMNFRMDETAGLVGTGTLTPSIPLLRSAQLTVEYGDGILRGSLSKQPKGNVAGIPGMRITAAELGVELAPEFRPYGFVEFAVGRVLTGRVEASFDGTGLVLQGNLDADLPGCERAQGTMEYRNGQLTGHVVITTDRIKLPGNPQGQLEFNYVNGRANVVGQVNVNIAGQDVTLGVRGQNPSALEWFGRGRFSVPGLEPVTMDITYSSARGFRGTGHTGFTLSSFHGEIDVIYENGAFTGIGTVNIHRGRASGSLTVRLGRSRKLSGEGSLTYQLTDNLTGTVGLLVPEDGPVRLSGELRFATIELFRRFAFNREFAGPHIQIPLLAIPLGVTNVGLIATVDAGVSIEISFGPGQLRDTRIGGAFNPFEENPDVEINAHSQLYIPARIALGANVRGGLGASIAVAEVTGGIRASANIGLNAATSLDVDLQYRRGSVNFGGKARAEITPTLGLSLDADINARAGIGPFSVGETWTWNLARYNVDTGLTFAAEADFGYSTERGMTLPSLDQIRFTAPDIDAQDIIRRLMNASSASQAA